MLIRSFFADSNTDLLKNIERKELEMKILHGNLLFSPFWFVNIR